VQIIQIWLLPKHSWSVSGTQGLAQPLESQALIAQVVINLRRFLETVLIVISCAQVGIRVRGGMDREGLSQRRYRLRVFAS